MNQIKVESLLSARQFVRPQLVEGLIYFISDMSGRLSLYRMEAGGSVPAPLIPPHIALPNPHHLGDSVCFRVLPRLGKILLMLDRDGDENYQPMFVPIDGGFPEPIFGDRFAGQQLFCAECDPDLGVALFSLDPRRDPMQHSFRVDLTTLETIRLGESLYGCLPVAHSTDFSLIVLADQYTFGDIALYRWRHGQGERTLFFGRPIELREAGEQVPPNGIRSMHLTPADGLLFVAALFDDAYGLCYLPVDRPEAVRPVEVRGLAHSGAGEMQSIDHLEGRRYALCFNIDGASWVYEGEFDEQGLCFQVRRVLVGQGELSAGVQESLFFDTRSGCFVLSFSTATSPSQLYLIEPGGVVRRLTDERILGIPAAQLAPGEEYPYTSHDGLRISARLYLPAPELGFSGPRPVVFYIHGGPQGQERPDFTWFSMPLIQLLALNGFAVWVPNVRGSEGYGLAYMKRVDHDWGGLDRLDHVAAFELLKQDPRLDMTRAGVMGRSYGGFMTLTQVGRHPELWKAAVDMFGPYDLFTFIDRLPEAWKTYFYIVLGHPERDHDELAARSPSTYLGNLACPLLVIQGANDPRVVERESRDVVERLRAEGKEVEYVVYGDEGHDVLKFPNKVDCYNRIAAFFQAALQP